MSRLLTNGQQRLVLRRQMETYYFNIPSSIGYLPIYVFSMEMYIVIILEFVGVILKVFQKASVITIPAMEKVN